MIKAHNPGRFGMTINFQDVSQPAIFLVSAVLLLAASEAGRFIGMRATGRGGDDVSTLEGAILGLLALMIGFTFAMTLSRFEARRDASWLRPTRLVPQHCVLAYCRRRTILK
jgi:hypothetical protein